MRPAKAAMERAPGAFMPAAALVGVAEAASWVGLLPLLALVPLAPPLLLSLPLPLEPVPPLEDDASVVVADTAPESVVVVVPVLVAAAEL